MGCRFNPFLPEDPVTPLLSTEFDEYPEPDIPEAKEWEDLEGPELPSDW